MPAYIEQKPSLANMPSRRSTRDSGPRTKYTEDPFASAGLLSDASDEDKSPSGKRKGKAKMDAVGPEDISASDEEFAASQDDDEEDEDFADEDDIASEEEAASPGIEMGEPREKPTPIRRNAKRREKLKKESGHRRKAMEDENYVHSRGMYNPVSNTGKDLSLQVNFGGDERDHLGAAYMRDRWQRGYDSTFPSRHSLNQAESFADYGFGTTFGADPEDVRRERTQGWDWYYDADVGQRFRKRQRLEKIGEDDARRIYMPASKGKHTVLVGPADEQKVVELGKDEVFNFGGAWGERKPGPKGTKAAKGEPGPTGNSRSTGSSKLREGWIINFGQKVQAMGWAPNQPGLTQYLAVVAPITKEQKAHYPDPLEGKVSPAFRPSAPYPNAVQIWSFKAKKDESLTKTLDMNSRPRLRLALCTEWGELRRFSWCPMPRDAREEDDEDVLKNIGLLAGVWTDGAVRVIDVKIPRSGDDTEFRKENPDSDMFESLS